MLLPAERGLVSLLFSWGVWTFAISTWYRSLLFDTLPWVVSGVFLSTMHPADLLNVFPELAQTLEASFILAYHLEFLLSFHFWIIYTPVNVTQKHSMYSKKHFILHFS